MITKLVLSVLLNESDTHFILADFLEENSLIYGKESLYYVAKLRTKFTTQTLIDVIMKFGSKKEKDLVGKVIRQGFRTLCYTMCMKKKTLSKIRNKGRCRFQEALLIKALSRTESKE